MRVDTLIIGGGIIGLAVAERLSRDGTQVVLVERHGRALMETSSRNSQVLHAGLYYAPGSLKAALCVRGNASLAAFMQAHGVPFARVGKLVVATSDAEVPALERLKAQGEANGVPLTLVGAAFVRAKEPDVHAVAALWSPTSGILDVHALADALWAKAKQQGADAAFHHAVTALKEKDGAWHVRLAGPHGAELEVEARRVVSCAGLDADTVAALAGLDVDALGWRQRWVKGCYFRLARGRKLHHLVYPLPAQGLAGLGVHVTVDLAGEARLGPDVHALSARVQDYDVPEALRGAFHEAARRYLPWLEPSMLEPDTAGIRPKLTLPGEPARDFVVAGEAVHGRRGLVCCVGLESPGLTCALELAEQVADAG